MPARGVAALGVARRFASAPTIRCRSASLAAVRPNHRLPVHPSMRRAQQCRYFASSLPPCYRHSRLTIVRRSCKRSRIAGVHGEAMYTALTLRSACSHSSYKLPMSGVEGDSLRLSLGDSKGVFSSEREYPLWCRGAHAALPSRASAGIRSSPFGLQHSRARGAKVVQIVNMGYLSPFPLFFLWIICCIDFWRFRG